MVSVWAITLRVSARLYIASEALDTFPLTRNRLLNDPRAVPTTMRSIPAMYGSDVHGLVWGYRFAPNEPALPITVESAVELFAAPDSSRPGEFFWLHFSLSNVATESWLQQNLTLPKTFYESLRLLVSARLRPLRSVDQLRAAVRAGEVFRSPVELLAHLLRDQASVLVDILRQAAPSQSLDEDEWNHHFLLLRS
jgi:zinc transporter